MNARRSSEAISIYLDRLYDAYDEFDVQQTTVTVSPGEFTTVATRGDSARVRVRVEGSDGVLAVRSDDGWSPPGGTVETLSDDWLAGDPTTSLETAAPKLVRRQTGIDCRVNDLLRLSLVCLQCEQSGDQVWEVSALFSGEPESGTPIEGAAWREHATELSVAF